MKFFGFGKKTAPTARTPMQIKTIGDITGSSFLRASFSGMTYLPPYEALNFYKESSAVATAVDMIAGEVEQIEPVLENLKDGSFTDKHAVLDLLRKPNPAQDYRAFVGESVRYWLLTHENYYYAEGGRKVLPANFWPVSPGVTSITEDDYDKYPKSISISSGPGTNDYIREEDVKTRSWHFLANDYAELNRMIGFSSNSSKTRADSPLLAAMQDVQQQIKGKLHNVQVLENGGRLSLVAIFRDTLEAEEHMARKNQLQSELGGSQNAGKIAAISSGDMELEEFGKSNKDMDYVNLDKISSTAIYMRYGIPLPLVSTDASTYNNMEQAKYDLYDRAVLPAFNILASAWSDALLARAGLDPKEFRITYNPEAIPALRGRLLDELKKRRDLNLETINEMRTLLPNREPISEGGDKIYQPGTLLPIGEDLFTADNVADMNEAAKNASRS